jgi:tetratricopeptide (TPR) repeat protein
VQLIDGNTGLHVESRVFQRPMRELFEMEEDVAASVATALRQRLGATFAMRNLSRGTRSVEALDLLLRSRQLREEAARIGLHPHENDTRSAQRILTSADSLLQLAQVADPRWTRPPLDRGWLRLQRRRIVGAAASRGVVGAAERFANDVLMREPQNAEAFQLRGTARWRLLSAPMIESADSTRAQQAEGDLRTALGLDSTLATGWATLADVLNVRGAIAEADVAASRALAQDAWLEGADETFFFAFASNLMLQRYGAAGRWCQEGQRVYPDSWRFYECELTLMRQDASLTPNATRAWSLVALMDSLDPPDRAKATGHSYSPLYRRGVAAAISARAGDRARAIRELDALRSSVSGDSVLALDLLYEEAAVRFELGQVSDARRLLEALFSARPMLRAQMARLPLIRAVTR